MEINFVEIFTYPTGEIKEIYAIKFILDISTSKLIYKEEFSKMYLDTEIIDEVYRKIIDLKNTIYGFNETEKTFSEDKNKVIPIFFKDSINVGFNINGKINKFGIEKIKTIDLKEIYNLSEENFFFSIDEVFFKEVGIINYLVSSYFRFFLKKIQEKDKKLIELLVNLER